MSLACPTMQLLRPVTDARRRVPRLVAGLVLCGLGIAFMVAADLGLAPWSVLDQGISDRTGIPIGTVRSRLFRARRHLQRSLWDLGVELGLVSDSGEPR